jgi:hypothetical protein
MWCKVMEYMLHTDADGVSDPYCLLPKGRRGATLEERHRIINEAAYRVAEQRGFAPGHELDDWLLAERVVGIILGTPLN